MKTIAKLAALTLLAMLTYAAEVSAQAPKAKGQPPGTPTPQATPSPSAQPAEAANGSSPGWVTRCASTGREAPLECSAEESEVLTRTGQLIVLVNIRVPGDTRKPVVLVQLPLGINLPAGAKIQVDSSKVIDLPVQTCDNRGCYANLPIAPDLLAALQSGKQLNVSFQNLANTPLSLPIPLTDFAAAYDKIK